MGLRTARPQRSDGVILVVDDDRDIREAVRDVLEDEGFAVATSAGVDEALSWLGGHAPPKLILLDWNMAPLNGAQFMERFGEEPDWQGIPVVLVTADGRIEREAMRERFDELLRKPVDLEQLCAVATRYAGH